MSSFDDLMDMSMDDIDDLPPMGVPPTGHYNLEVTASREAKDGGGDYIKFHYVIEDVNEVKNPEEADQAVIGQSFTEFFSPLKKDGSTNELGMQFLKKAMVPFAEYFGTGNFAAVLAGINNVSVAATLTRTKDKKDADRFNFRLADVVVL